MGIRVHKMMGYGLTDVKRKKKGKYITDIDDPRINPKGFFSSDCEYLENKFTKEKYIKFIKNIPAFEKSWEMDTIEQFNWSPWQSFVHNGEYGMPNVICIIPVCMFHQWNRYDDAIDYVEEGKGSNGNRVEELDSGIYPWNVDYMDIRTGEKIVNTYVHHFVWTCKSNHRSKAGLKKLAELSGFSSTAEAKKNIAPCVPDGVKRLCKFGKVFTSDDVIKQLRPILYVYWG